MGRPRTPPIEIEVSTFQSEGAKMALVSFPIQGRFALTRAEHRVVSLAILGESNAQIAHAISVSERTVASHLARAMRKLRVGSRAELAVKLAALLSPREP